MYISYSNEVRSVFLVVLVKIRNVLEVVRIYISVCCSNVRLYIVIEFDYFERPSVLCQFVCYRIEYLCMRCRGCSYLDDLIRIRF